MPFLQVGELTIDPDLCTPNLICTRGVQVVGDDGIAVNATSQSFKFTGVVTSDTGIALDRQADGQRIHQGITIHSRFEMIEGDLITWSGSQYTVTNISPYEGFGFVAAKCELLPISG